MGDVASASKRAERRAIVVLGMHRSGTSALARVLSLRGAELPRQLMPANDGNPSGYWEPEPIVAFNDEMFGFFGTSWDDPFAAFQLPAAADFPARFRQRAAELLESEFGTADLFVLKDPRCTLLADFWMSVIEDAGVVPVPVVILRQPGEVADSLRRRDGMSPTFASLLYVAYGLECMGVAGRREATVLTYAHLLADWKAATDGIAADHGFAWPIRGARSQARIEAFLQPVERTARRIKLPAPLSGWVADTWDWVERRAGGKSAAPEDEALRSALEAAANVYAPAIAWRGRQLDAAMDATEELRSERDGLQAQLDELAALRERDLASKADELAVLAGQRDELAVDRDRALEQLRSLEREHQALAEAHQAAESDRASRSDDIKVLVAQRDEFAGDRDRALEQLRSLEREHGALADAHRAREQQLAAKAEAAAALVAQRDEFAGDRDRALEQLRSLEREHGALADAHRASEQQLAARVEEVAALASQRDEFAGDRDRALEQLRLLEREHAALADAHRASEQQLAARVEEAAVLVAQRDAFAADRDRALEQLRSLESEHGALADAHRASEQQLAARADEVADLVAQRDAAAADLVAHDEAAAAALADSRAHADALDRERQHLVEEHRKLCAMHEDALLRQDRATRRISVLEHALAEERRVVEEIRASTSWRLTAPLREAREASRRLLRRIPGNGAGTQLQLPGPARAPDDDIPAGDPGVVRHAGLRAFLDEEFGAEQAATIIARIDRHGLEADVSEARSAVDAAFDPVEAVKRARKLAVKAANAGFGRFEPDVSIILPVYNQVRFTLACLDALVSHESRYRFEVLVGDDASSDATASAMDVAIPGVRHVRHQANLGFVRNCNATAEAAKGRFLVFLNNDTQVLPGWLDELVGTLERDAGIGLAGSKLVFPDGRLQECGAIVWQDGSAWNLGRLEDPRRPEYSYLRDCDYVSGASIALEAGLWRRLGGFDELFVPAYAEDADLAFRVRDAGLRTVVQPLSQLLHFEGISSGTDTSRGVKAHQVTNLEKLRERWGHVLASHRPNAESPSLEKERNVSKRVLFIDHCTPTPNEDAGSRVAWEVMAAFQADGFKVTFIPEDNFAHMGADTRALQRVGIEPIYHPSYSTMPAFLDARDDPFDVVFLHRYKVGEAHLHDVRKHYPEARVMFLNADMHFLREMREAEVSGDAAAMAAARRTRSRELSVVRGVDATLVHSEAELEILASECPDKSVSLFPLIHDPVPNPAPLEGRAGLCFVGGFRHPPNADGIVWFVDEVWPLVLAAKPDALLRIAGSHMTPEVTALAGRRQVEVAGFVEDLPTFLAGHRVSIAPLRYGAGAKGKVAESLAHGLPVVGTPIAVEGMQLAADRNVLVGDSAQSFADGVVRLLSDDALWERMSIAGLAYADEVTSRRHARHRIHAALAGLQ